MKAILKSLLSPSRRTPVASARATARLLQQALELGRTLRAASPAGSAVPATPTPTTSPGSFTELAHTAAGLSRRYKLFVPATVAPSPALVVMLHGCTQNADDFAAGTRMNAWAARDGFLVAYPIQARTANAAGCWNWFRDQDQRREQGEAAFLADLALTVARQHGVERGAIYAAGLSAGAAMAAILAREYPEVFAAVALHSGLAAGSAHNVPDAMRVMQSGRPGSQRTPQPPQVPVPAIVFHGDLDRTVHPSNAEHLVLSLLPAGHGAPRVTQIDGDARRPVTKTTYAGAGSATLLESWTLHGAGHAWSGGDRSGTYTDPDGPDATAECVRFFAAHRRSTPARHR